MSTPARAPVSVERSGWWLAGGALTITAIGLFSLAYLRGEDTGRGLVIGPLVALAVVPLIAHARRSELRFDLAGILFAAVGAKLCAVYLRFWMVDSLYDGTGDSTTYHLYGEAFAPFFRRLDFDIDPGRPIPGTGFIRVLTAGVYALLGSDRFTGFLVFGLISLLGCWCFYKAFTTALPGGDHKRYALLVFFWPSLLFWPSAIGKEAWMLLALGLSSWGAAAIYARRQRGFLIFATGVLAATMPRPHIAIVVVAATGVGLVMASLFRSGEGVTSVTFATRLGGSVFLLVIGSLLAPKLATFLNIDDVGGSGFTDSLDAVLRQTAQGGSNFSPAAIESPLDYPWALVTVLFRPFPFEITSAATAVTAMEGTLLLILLVASFGRLARLPASLVKNAYVAYVAAFTFMFCYVFAFIANFGILARQRSQLMPFLFVLIAVPAAARARRRPRVVSPPEEPEVVDVRSFEAPALSPPRARS